MTSAHFINDFSANVGGRFARDLDGAPSAKCINLRVDGESLVDGTSFTSFGPTLPNGEILALSYYKTERGEAVAVVVKEGDGCAFYASHGENYEKIADISLGSSPMICGVHALTRDGFAAADETGKLYFYDGNKTETHSCPTGGKALVMFDGRLVLVTASAVHISGLALPFTFDAYGSASLDLPVGMDAGGAKLFGGGVVIAGVKGMAKLLKSYKGNYYLKTVATGGERLYPNTLAVGEDRAVIAGDAGIAEYDGLELGFKLAEIAKEITEPRAGIIVGSEYFLSHSGGTLIIGGQTERSDVPVKFAVSAPFGPIFAAENARTLLTLGTPSAYPAGRRIYETAATDFGTAGKKTLLSVGAVTKRPLTLIVTADGKNRLYKMKGGRGKSRARMAVKGDVFSFRFIMTGTGNCLSAVEFVTEE